MYNTAATDSVDYIGSASIDTGVNVGIWRGATHILMECSCMGFAFRRSIEYTRPEAIAEIVNAQALEAKRLWLNYCMFNLGTYLVRPGIDLVLNGVYPLS